MVVEVGAESKRTVFTQFHGLFCRATGRILLYHGLKLDVVWMKSVQSLIYVAQLVAHRIIFLKKRHNASQIVDRGTQLFFKGLSFVL